MTLKLTDLFHETMETKCKNRRDEQGELIRIVNQYLIGNDTLDDDYFDPQDSEEGERFNLFVQLLRDGMPLEERRIRGHPLFFNTLTKHGIHTPDILHWYIMEFLGFNIPRVPVCRLHNPQYEKQDYPHCAPFDYISDMFFELVRNSIAFANRTGGKTRNVSILNHLDMTFKSGCEVASAGAILEQANKVYAYFLEIHSELPVILYGKEPTRSKTYYINGSQLEVLTGTISGLNSPHPQKARIDEVELMDWRVLQEALSMSKSKRIGKRGILGQNSFLCVSGDTLIDVVRDKHKNPDGVKIKTLVGRDNIWAYCFSECAGRFTLRKINKIWKTGRKSVYRLTYRWGDKTGELIATGNHPIMLRDGTYKELSQLERDDRLMAFQTRWVKGYRQIDLGCKLNPRHPLEGRKWMPEYVYVHGKVKGKWCSRGEVIHHIDYNTKNDLPDNLKKMPLSKHQKHHTKQFTSKKQLLANGKLLAKYNKKFWSNDGDKLLQDKKREKCRERSVRRWIDSRDVMMGAVAKSHTDDINRKRSETMKGKLAGDKNPMYGIPYEKHPKGFLGGKHTEEAKRRISEGVKKYNKNRWKTQERIEQLINSYNVKRLYEKEKHSISMIVKETGATWMVVVRSLESLGVKLRNKSEANSVMWNFVDMESFRKKKRIQMLKQYGNYKEEEEQLSNHVVLSVEKLDKRINVYDMEVEGHHNFVTGDGLVLHNSTRKYDTGTFGRLLEESKKRKMHIYSWCIFEVLERCTRKCSEECPAWGECRGLIAPHCDGFYQLGDFLDDKATTLNSDTLDTQWYNKRPSKDIMVYSTYDEAVHKRPESVIRDLIGTDTLTISAIDFGSSPGHPFVYSKYVVDYTDLLRAVEEAEPEQDATIMTYRLLFVLIYEYRSASATLAQHAMRIKDSPGFEIGEIILADPSAKQARIDLEELHNLPTIMAVNAVEDGIDLVRNHLEIYTDYSVGGGMRKSYLYIQEDYLDTEDGELIGTDVEFTKYKYPRMQDGKVSRKIPIKLFDHGMDTMRYVVQTAYKIIPELVTPSVEIIEQEGYWFGGR